MSQLHAVKAVASFYRKYLPGVPGIGTASSLKYFPSLLHIHAVGDTFHILCNTMASRLL